MVQIQMHFVCIRICSLITFARGSTKLPHGRDVNPSGKAWNLDVWRIDSPNDRR